MKKTGRLIVCAGILCTFHITLCAQSQHFTVTGHIRGAGDDTIILVTRQDDKKHVSDTFQTIAHDDHFTVRGSITGTQPVSAVIGHPKERKNFSFYLEPGNIYLSGSVDSVEYINAEGTTTNAERTALQAGENKLYARLRAIRAQLAKESKGSEQSSILGNQAGAIRDSIAQWRMQFVQAHPASPVSVTCLYLLQDNMPVSQLERLYQALPPTLQTTGFGPGIAEKIVARKKTSIGSPAPLFSMQDINGKNVDFASFKGQYVLLDFWASWCVPCRAESPFLVSAYRDFKDKNFTIISISVDHIAANWKEAVIKDSLNWTHLSDLQASNNKVAKLYGVQPIPDNFLIDPTGKIIARGLRGESLHTILRKFIQ